MAKEKEESMADALAEEPHLVYSPSRAKKIGFITND